VHACVYQFFLLLFPPCDLSVNIFMGTSFLICIIFSNHITCLTLSNGEFGLHTFNLWGRDDFMTIATTRPETLFGDVAIAVNPEVCSIAVSPDYMSVPDSKYKCIIKLFVHFVATYFTTTSSYFISRRD
jgi:hypothetical protein